MVKTRNHFLSQFHGEVQRIPDFFFWLLIVSRARHAFGTGPGIIQQGTAAKDIPKCFLRTPVIGVVSPSHDSYIQQSNLQPAG